MDPRRVLDHGATEKERGGGGEEKKKGGRPPTWPHRTHKNGRGGEGPADLAALPELSSSTTRTHAEPTQSTLREASPRVLLSQPIGASQAGCRTSAACISIGGMLLFPSSPPSFRPLRIKKAKPTAITAPAAVPAMMM
eukprot:Sspe_Gene.45890::Locus_22792_Transcript_1_1_Confidence_1.000_Length_754::g.45890::m.45890